MRVSRRAIAVIIVAVAGLYGAADQFLGSRVELGEWTVSVSQMSAPWLAIAFLAGAWPGRRLQAVAMGSLVTIAAVGGYLAMTLSPVEGVAVQSIHWEPEVRSQLHIILPALMTGPAFGWLGWYWQATRTRLAAMLMAGFFVLEPLVRLLCGQLIDSRSPAWPTEIAVGITLALAVSLSRGRPAPPRSPQPRPPSLD
jgi:hypothetical protein